MNANAANRLLDHYRANARQLPWRSPPGSQPPEPYRVWLSEVMLQQTTVAAVTPRFERFVQRWPTAGALAAAADEDILAEWAGLGYYARARNLIACARQVAALGGFPETEDELRKLPGVGAYTAAAIAAIAFDRRAVVIDTNVERVVARLHALKDKTEVAPRADALTPLSGCGDFAQAMMDLGATICRPKAPQCGICPLRADCRAAQLSCPEAFPAKAEKRVRPLRFGVAYWCRQDDYIRLVRRDPKGMLGGMAALPGGEWAGERRRVNAIAVIRHDFTHFSLQLEVVAAEDSEPDGWWQPLATLEKAGLPTLYRKAVAAALQAEQEPRIAA
ncbi:A/G-specific adenine glycosylase [Sphingomonas sp. GCM10030256]|uniref:A/G-specific adenine glycosylase n=1 Tax=Sphingomonas sp. GCM10030256 TaxID=3273427 RepID=UPI003615B435